MAGALTRILGGIADVFWPRACAVETCARPSDRANRHICSSCFAGLPFHETGGACRICGTTIVSKVQHDFICEVCSKTPPPFEFARSAVRFEEPCRQLLLDFKFGHATWLEADLVDLLEAAVRAKLDAPAIDVIVPVPLHQSRLRERGYNQSALLATGLARRLYRRADLQALVRTRDTGHQARLSGEARLTNLKDAFGVDVASGIRGRTVLLIDDVMTTGTTLSACAAPLLAAGASRIWCATVARAIRH